MRLYIYQNILRRCIPVSYVSMSGYVTIEGNAFRIQERYLVNKIQLSGCSMHDTGTVVRGNVHDTGSFVRVQYA